MQAGGRLLGSTGGDALAGDGDGAEESQLVVRQQQLLWSQQGLVLYKLAVTWVESHQLEFLTERQPSLTEGMIENFVLLIDGFCVDQIVLGVHHTELDLSPQVGRLFSTRVFEEESDVALVHGFPSIGIHLQSPLGQLPLHRHRELVRVHGLACSHNTITILPLARTFM